MSEKTNKLIGVVGGVGPYAGLDLVRKIFDLTKASCDQDHLPVSLLSMPHIIGDRTEFIVGLSSVNPAEALAEVICSLHDQGASIIGIPRNTAPAAPIFNEILNRIPKKIKIIHMINEVADVIKNKYPTKKRIGVLSTSGTIASNVYKDCLSKYDLIPIQINDEWYRFSYERRS